MGENRISNLVERSAKNFIQVFLVIKIQGLRQDYTARRDAMVDLFVESFNLVEKQSIDGHLQYVGYLDDGEKQWEKRLAYRDPNDFQSVGSVDI